jgi:hypothetical protein
MTNGAWSRGRGGQQQGTDRQKRRQGFRHHQSRLMQQDRIADDQNARDIGEDSKLPPPPESVRQPYRRQAERKVQHGDGGLRLPRPSQASRQQERIEWGPIGGWLLAVPKYAQS